jgi:hypothetical protein
MFETELEWLLYHLWNKVTAKPPIFSFALPQTVIFKAGKPTAWYFKSKDGFILKKNASNVTLVNIQKEFTLKDY